VASSESRLAGQTAARVLNIRPEPSKFVCRISDGREIVLSRLVGSNMQAGDEILVPTPANMNAADADREIYIHKPSFPKADVYQIKAGYAALPKQDRRGEFFVAVQVLGGQLGIDSVHIPCHVIRDYFFAANRNASWSSQPSFYYILHLPEDVKSEELRLGYRIRRIELRRENASKLDLATLERAYNMLAFPVFRIRISSDSGWARPGQRCLLRESDLGVHARAADPQGSDGSSQARLFR
jgi:hypothetical protein